MKFPLKPPCIGNFALPELCFRGLPQKGQDLAKDLQRNLGVVLTSVAIQAVLKMEGLDSIQNGDDWGWSRVEPMVFRVYLNFGKHQPFRSGSNIGYPEISKIPWLTAKLGETIWVKIWAKQKDCTHIENALTHRIHGAAIYGVPWIPSIYPSHVSIYSSTMDPMGYLKRVPRAFIDHVQSIANHDVMTMSNENHYFIIFDLTKSIASHFLIGNSPPSRLRCSSAWDPTILGTLLARCVKSFPTTREHLKYAFIYIITSMYTRCIDIYWLVVSTPLKMISQLASVGMIIPKIWKKQNHVPNHQSVYEISMIQFSNWMYLAPPFCRRVTSVAVACGSSPGVGRRLGDCRAAEGDLTLSQ